MPQSDLIPSDSYAFQKRLEEDYFNTALPSQKEEDTSFLYEQIKRQIEHYSAQRRTFESNPQMSGMQSSFFKKQVVDLIESASEPSSVVNYVEQKDGQKQDLLSLAIRLKCDAIIPTLASYKTPEQKSKALMAFVPVQRDFRMGVLLCSVGADINYVPPYEKLGLEPTQDTPLFRYLNEKLSGRVFNKPLPCLQTERDSSFANFWKNVNLAYKNKKGQTLFTLSCARGDLTENAGSLGLLALLKKLPDKKTFEKALNWFKSYKALVKRLPKQDWDAFINYGGYRSEGQRIIAQRGHFLITAVEEARKNEGPISTPVREKPAKESPEKAMEKPAQTPAPSKTVQLTLFDEKQALPKTPPKTVKSNNEYIQPFLFPELERND